VSFCSICFRIFSRVLVAGILLFFASRGAAEATDPISTQEPQAGTLLRRELKGFVRPMTNRKLEADIQHWQNGALLTLEVTPWTQASAAMPELSGVQVLDEVEGLMLEEFWAKPL